MNCGATVANLRRLAFQLVTAPRRLGWFVERRFHQYLTLCASCGHIDTVNETLFDFQAKQQHLEDSLFLHPLCLSLKTKLGLADASSVPRSGGGGGGPGRIGSAYPTNAVRNPSGRLFKITSRDVWHFSWITPEMRPSPTSAVTLTGGQTSALGKWIKSCRACMPRQPAEAAKKPKLVGNSDLAYTDLPLDPRWMPTNKPVLRTNSNLLEHSAAARLHASTRGSTSPHVLQALLEPAITRPFAPLGSLDAHAIAGAQTVRPQAALLFPSPAPRRVRTPTSSCPARPHVPSTLTGVPTPHTLPAQRQSFVRLPPPALFALWIDVSTAPSHDPPGRAPCHPGGPAVAHAHDGIRF